MRSVHAADVAIYAEGRIYHAQRPSVMELPAIAAKRISDLIERLTGKFRLASVPTTLACLMTTNRDQGAE